jgi:hypothetical protein
VGFELGPFDRQADAMTTAPGLKNELLCMWPLTRDVSDDHIFYHGKHFFTTVSIFSNF